MIGCAICLVLMAVAVFVATRIAKILPGDFRVWASVAGLLLGSIFLTTDPNHPAVGLSVGVAFLFCATVAIYREPTKAKAA